jgi:hypothetical protein
MQRCVNKLNVCGHTQLNNWILVREGKNLLYLLFHTPCSHALPTESVCPGLTGRIVDSPPSVFQYLIHLRWPDVCSTKKSLTLPLSLLYNKSHPACNQNKIQTKPISKPNEASALDQAKLCSIPNHTPDAILTVPFYHTKPNIFCTPNQTLKPAKFFCFLFWTKLKLRSIPNPTPDAILTLPLYHT